MRKHKIIILNPAKNDVKEARYWYNQQLQGLGKRFSADLRNTLLIIANNPTSYAIRYGANRKANLSKFPFGIFFYIDAINYTVYITAVKHSARDFIK